MIKTVRNSFLQLYVDSQIGRLEKPSSRGTRMYSVVLTLLIVTMLSGTLVFGADIAVISNVKTALATLYNALFGVTTAVAAVLLLAALIVRMLSNNPRSIETATSWAKRILITYAAINLIGYGFSFVNSIVGTGNSSWSSIVQ